MKAIKDNFAQLQENFILSSHTNKIDQFSGMVIN